MSLFADMLAEGDRKQIGRSGEIATIIVETPPLLEDLLNCLMDGDETVRAHGTHALMQVGIRHPELIEPFSGLILDKIAGLEQWEVQQQVLKILPKMKLSSGNRAIAIDHARRQLNHKAAFVRTDALQALADFSKSDPSLKKEVRAVLENASENGAKSMQARARRLLADL